MEAVIKMSEDLNVPQYKVLERFNIDNIRFQYHAINGKLYGGYHNYPPPRLKDMLKFLVLSQHYAKNKIINAIRFLKFSIQDHIVKITVKWRIFKYSPIKKFDTLIRWNKYYSYKINNRQNCFYEKSR